MDYRIRNVNPQGRTTYGSYYNASNLKQSIVKNIFNGNDSTEDIVTPDDNDKEKPQDGFVIFLAHGYKAIDNSKLYAAKSGITDSISVSGYKGSNEAQTFIGQITGNTVISKGVDEEGEETIVFDPEHPNMDISGVCEGMSIRVLNNGTTRTELQVKFTKDIRQIDEQGQNTGTLQIPCSVYMGDLPLEPSIHINEGDITQWEGVSDLCASVVLEYTWTIIDIPNGKFRVDLTNEMAYVNTDEDGNVLPGSYKPDSKVNVYYGSAQVVSGVTYTLSTFNPQLEVTGVNLSEDGVITLGDDFNFKNSDNLPITVSVVIEGDCTVKDVSGKLTNINEGRFEGYGVYKIYKSKDGIVRWITLSTSEVVYNPNDGTFNPESVSAVVYMQNRDNPIEIDTTTKVWYGFDRTTPNIEYTGPITLTEEHSAYTYIIFGLYNGDFWYELENCFILRNGKDGKDGKDGQQGPQGLIGPAVRGPVEWIHQGARWYMAGDGNPEIADSDKWIDIILGPDGNYYRCKTSYYDNGSSNWQSVAENWEMADAQYKFIATELLLADAAKIKFLTNNQLTLTYLENGVEKIAGGAQGGKNVVFWAGSEQPSPSPFEVYYDGSIKATKGEFGCLSIGNNEWGESILEGTRWDYELGACSIELDPKGVCFTSDYVKVAVAANTERFQGNAPVAIYLDDTYGDAENGMAIDTNGRIECGNLTVNSEPVVTCEEDIKIKIVTQMPANPDAKTLYIVIEV